MYEDEWRNLPFRYDVGWYFSTVESGTGFPLGSNQQFTSGDDSGSRVVHAGLFF